MKKTSFIAWLISRSTQYSLNLFFLPVASVRRLP